VLANYATVRAKGLGARMRGMKHRQRRPDLAILDDPESPETADTFLKRNRHKRWFGGTFMGLGADGWDIFVIGNLPHHDCLIADLVKDSGWDGKLWRAENIPERPEERYPVGNTRTDGSALWPEMWSLEKLMKYRAEPNVGALGYAREMMNDPREEEHKAFNLSEFCFFDFVIEDLSNYSELVISLDPAGGENPGEVRRGKRDYAVAVVMGRTKTTPVHIDVLDVWMKKVLPDAQIDAVLDLYTFFPAVISAEENMFKNLLKTSLERRSRERGLFPHVKVRTSAQNKITRILSLQPPIRQHIMRFAKHIKDKYPEYFAHFDEFPGTYDDAPDATEGGLRALEKVMPARIISLTGTSYWKGRT
jgi:predicted phage terminase large subunit-like protein